MMCARQRWNQLGQNECDVIQQLVTRCRAICTTTSHFEGSSLTEVYTVTSVVHAKQRKSQPELEPSK